MTRDVVPEAAPTVVLCASAVGSLTPEPFEMQLATSFLPAAVACGTRLAERDTGPGGIYDLLEDMGHRPLAWEESVGARMPTPAEAGRLGLPKGIPLLRIVRMTTGPDGSVLEVNDTRMSAEAFEVGYSVTRHPSAESPR